MLVKKIEPEWFPSEKKDLAVGEIIDITDAKSLILQGKVVAVDERGVELSTYETYGVMTPREQEEFKEFLEWKRLQREKEYAKKLEEENAKLKEEVLSTEAPKATLSEEEKLAEIEKSREARAKK